MSRATIIAGLSAAIAASLVGFPFEAIGAHAAAGASFVVWALGLFVAAALLAIQAGRARQDVAAVGFAAVALYAAGTALNSALLARGLVEVSVGVQPGIWALLALGLILLATSSSLPRWVRVIGVVAAIGHAMAASALLFGAEMPHTGAEATDFAPLVVAISKLLLWATMIGWIIAIRRERAVALTASASGTRDARHSVASDA